MGSELRVLLVEDDPDDAELVRASLRGTPFALEWRQGLAPALERLGAGGIDVILSDLNLPDSKGLDTVRRIRAKARGLPLVVLTGSVGTEAGLEAVRAGAQDYLSKDEVLGPRLARTLSFAYERVELDRFESELLRMVGHELRSPACTAYGYLELLRDGHGGPLAPQAREYALNSLRALEHLLAMLDDLSQAHRAGLGRLKVEPRELDAGAALEEVAEALGARAREKGIVLRVEARATGAVRADPERLRQVLTNLVDNALKFTRRGGRVELRVEPDQDRARFSVLDTGPGISPAEAARIFEKLYQAPLGKGAGGLGLGLYIAREFVRLQGGTIWVESEPGKGTAFRFTLPRAAVLSGR